MLYKPGQMLCVTSASAPLWELAFIANPSAHLKEETFPDSSSRLLGSVDRGEIVFVLECIEGPGEHSEQVKVLAREGIGWIYQAQERLKNVCDI